jgi:hypothetical protein
VSVSLGEVQLEIFRMEVRWIPLSGAKRPTGGNPRKAHYIQPDTEPAMAGRPSGMITGNFESLLFI